MNTIAPEVLKELDELIVQLIKDAKKDPTTEKLKALTELLSARANMDYQSSLDASFSYKVL